MKVGQITITGLEGIPKVKKGDDIADISVLKNVGFYRVVFQRVYTPMG